MTDKRFLLEPEFQKCVTLCEFWKKGDAIIERAQLWRFGKILVQAKSESEIRKTLKQRDFQDRICVNEKFECLDDTLQDCVSDDLYFPDEMNPKEVKRLSKLFAKDAEGMFEREKWDIEETKLYFEANIKVTLSK